MKTTETQKPTEVQQKVLDYVQKFSNSNAEFIVSGTQMNKLLVGKILKGLTEKGLLIKSSWPDSPDTYKLPIDDLSKPKAAENKLAKTAAIAEEKITGAIGKKSTKTEKVDEEKVT